MQYPFLFTIKYINIVRILQVWLILYKQMQNSGTPLIKYLKKETYLGVTGL